MAINRGKAFENIIKDGMEKVVGVSIDRLRDPVGGQLGVRNFCDFITYKKPFQYYFECKAVSGNTLNFTSHISEYQWAGLLEKSKIEGVCAGVIVWFIDRDITLFVKIDKLERMRVSGKKSLNIVELAAERDDFEIMFIDGKKKRVFFNYDLSRFLSSMQRAIFMGRM